MVVDEKDLGVRPVHAGLLALADKMDEEKRALEKAIEPILAGARNLLQLGEHAHAAALYDFIAATFAKAHWPNEAKQYAERAAACRKAPPAKRGRRP